MKKLLVIEDNAEVRENLAELPIEIQQLEKVITHLDEGRGHRGDASVVRVVFKKI